MLIDLSTAKLQASIDADADDALITIYIGAAERFAAEYMQRNIYADQAALDAAVAAAPGVFAAAVTAYDAKILAASALADGEVKEMVVFAAESALSDARQAARMAMQGKVIDDGIKSAMLLIIGHLYLNREENSPGAPIVEVPMGAKSFLDLSQAY